MWKKVRLGNGEIEYVHNARQLLDTLEDDLPWAHRLDVVYKSCAGIQCLHENGIVHCDVKAGNIFIRGGSESEYVVKVGDFGQANFDFGQFSVTQTSSFLSTDSSRERSKVGTAPYIAPELIELGAKRNFSSVVYSMGMVMVEFTMPERSHPWEGELSSCDLIFRHVLQGRRPTIIPSKLNALENNFKEDWLRTIETCLEHDPEKRPPIATVTQILGNLSTSGTEPELSAQTEASEPVHEGVTIENIVLNIHQGTVLESAGDIAMRLHEHEGATERVQEDLNACVQKHGWNQRLRLPCSEKRRQHSFQP